MTSKNFFPQTILMAVMLLALGCLGIYWPSLVGADAVVPAARPLATVEDAISYQGYLTDDKGAPLEGTFTMRFVVFNDAVAGTAVWDSGNLSVEVVDGVFTARLLINTDIFNGEELWVSQIVNGETLTPRQEILPTAMAHTLRPGAIVKGTANAIPNNYLLDVQMNNDTFAFNRGAITGQTTTGNAIYGLAENGRAIYGQTQDGYAVYGFDGGSTAEKGYGGYFYSTNGIGVYGYSGADKTAQNNYAPGVYGQSNQGVGVYGRGDTSDSHVSFNEGGYFIGGKGIYARGTDPSGQQGYGARIFSSNYRGMYVEGSGGFFDAYFGGTAGISANSYIDRTAAQRALVVNLGQTPIYVGDFVAMVGVTTSVENDQPILAVARVDETNVHAVIGVATQRIEVSEVEMEDGQHYVDFAPAAGVVKPKDYLVVITGGLAPAVNVDSLALLVDGEIGDTLSISIHQGSRLSLARGGDGPTVGKLASTVDETGGTVAMFIDID